MAHVRGLNGVCMSSVGNVSVYTVEAAGSLPSSIIIVSWHIPLIAWTRKNLFWIYKSNEDNWFFVDPLNNQKPSLQMHVAVNHIFDNAPVL